MKRRYIYLASIFICLIFIISLFGCTSSNTTTTTTSSTSVTTTQTSQPMPSSTTATQSTLTETSTSTPTYAAELLVFAAGGTKAPVDAAAATFQQKFGTKITINYGGGGEVLNNMVLAKQGDIFIAPEQRFMNSAKSKGAVDNAATPAALAYMIPVIGVQKGNPLNIQSLVDLGKSGVKIAVGSSDTTLLGEIIPGMLQKAGVYDSVYPNIVTNVPQVNTIITNLKTKQVDAGIIWHYFSVTNASDVDIIWIPAEYITGIGEIQAAVTTYSQESWTAQQFINFLASAEGQAIFKQNGYIIDKNKADNYYTPD
ncbi:MAG: substrate-binding domain-containing protein [Dehalococcoidales bacterium]|nr:substrate-binding domain-containing protein [Dehalococcoidales bacterium]